MTVLPTKVEPVSGARRAPFPWTEAAALVAALDDAATTLQSQLDSRPAMIDTIVDWVGMFRDDFDTTYSEVTGAATDLRTSCATAAGAIATDAEAANSLQRTYNQRAEAGIRGHGPPI